MGTEREVRYFEAHASTWGSNYEAATAAGHSLQVRKRRVLELLNGLTGDVLDVGCGPGMFASELTQQGLRFFGIDRALGMVAAARQAPVAGGIHLAVADATALPFPSDRFDALVCTGVLDRIPNQQRAISEFARVVRPGGRIVISFPNALSPYTVWSSYVFRPLIGWMKSTACWICRRPIPPNRDSSAILRTRGWAAAICDNAGATTMHVTYFHFNVLLSPLDEAFPRIAASTVRHLEWLRTTRLSWLGTGFLVCAQVRPSPEREAEGSAQ